MNPQDLYNTPQVPGIYLFKNKINGKCYVGQAKLSLRRRLLHHKNNLEHERYDAPIYKALKKYGWENFDFYILEQFDEEYTDELGKKLDELEIHYISVYNSYGKTGYNQTKGGDAGITGYKFTDEQRKRVSNNSKISARIHAENIDKRIYVYDLKTNELKMFRMWSDVCEYTGHHTHQCKNIVHFDRYLIAFSEEEIENKKILYKEKNIYNVRTYHVRTNHGGSKPHMTEEMKEDIINGIAQKEYCKKYKVCKKTFINHRNLLIPDYKREYKQKINDEEFAEYYIQHPSVSECVEHFNSSERYIYKKIERARKLGLLPANIRKENNNGAYEPNTLKTHRLSDKKENKKPHIDPIAPKSQNVKVCTDDIDNEFIRKFVLYYKKNPDFMKCANRFCKSLEYISFLYNKCVENGYIIIPTETNKETSVSTSSQTVSDELTVSDKPTGLNPSISHPTPKFVQNTLF